MKINLKQQFSAQIQKFLGTNLSDKPFIVRKGYQFLRVFYAVARDTTDGQFSLRAMSLVYTTLITLVPLIALSFSVLKGLGIHNQIEPMLKQLLSGLGRQQSAEITEKIVSFVDNIEVGVLGVVGLALLIYSVIALMQKIEWAFNAIWRVGKGRSMARRISDYLTVLFVGPLAIFLSTSATSMVRHSPTFENLEDTILLAPLVPFIGWLIPWLVLTIGFMFLYILIPNTKVNVYPAFIGGLFAALIWKVMGFVFALFVASATGYVAIYAAFATLILFMIWVYVGWLVVLIGCNIAFYVQNPKFIRKVRSSFVLSPKLIQAYGLGCIYYIGCAHHEQGAPEYTTEDLANKLNAPVIAIEKILETLKNCNLVLSNEEATQTWHPAVSYNTTNLQSVFDALEQYGHEDDTNPQKANCPESVSALIGKIEDKKKKFFGEKTIEEALKIKPEKKG